MRGQSLTLGSVAQYIERAIADFAREPQWRANRERAFYSLPTNVRFRVDTTFCGANVRLWPKADTSAYHQKRTSSPTGGFLWNFDWTTVQLDLLHLIPTITRGLANARSPSSVRQR